MLEGAGGGRMARFCANCGAKTGPEPVGSAANAPPAARATSPAAPVGTPGARSGSSGVKVLLIVLGVFTGLTVLGIGSCVYVGYRIKRKIEETVKVDKAGESGQTVTISTPGGQIKLSDRTGQRAGSEIGGA